MSALEQIQAMLHSRKFWAMVSAILAAAAGLATNQIDTWQFIIAVVASMAAYSTGIAIEDAGTKIGAAQALPQPAPQILIDRNFATAQPVNEPLQSIAPQASTGAPRSNLEDTGPNYG